MPRSRSECRAGSRTCSGKISCRWSRATPPPCSPTIGSRLREACATGRCWRSCRPMLWSSGSTFPTSRCACCAGIRARSPHSDSVPVASAVPVRASSCSSSAMIRCNSISPHGPSHCRSCSRRRRRAWSSARTLLRSFAGTAWPRHKRSSAASPSRTRPTSVRRPWSIGSPMRRRAPTPPTTGSTTGTLSGTTSRMPVSAARAGTRRTRSMRRPGATVRPSV